MRSPSTHYTDLEPLARHEAAHALHGHLVGHIIEQVVVTNRQGVTVSILPMTPGDLAAKWQMSPIRWSAELCRAIASLRAGSLFENPGVEIYGGDLESLSEWRDRYVGSIGTHADWTRLYASTYQSLLRWQQRASVQQAVHAIAAALLRQGETSRPALLSIFEHCLVAYVPDPVYEAVLPSPQRTPAPVVSTSSPRRVAGQVGVDLKKFARDAHGRVRQLTDSEWMFLKEHGVEAVANTFTDAELDNLEAAMQAAVATQSQRLARR